MYFYEIQILIVTGIPERTENEPKRMLYGKLFSVKPNGKINLYNCERTKIIDHYTNWDQKIPLTLNKGELGIKIEIWDHNKYFSDEFLGYCYIPLESILTDELTSRVLELKQSDIMFVRENKTNNNKIVKKGRKRTKRVQSHISLMKERKIIYQINTKQSGKVMNSSLIDNLPKKMASKIIKYVNVDSSCEPESSNLFNNLSNLDLLKGEVIRDCAEEVQLLEKTANVDTYGLENLHGMWLRSRGKLYITNFRLLFVSERDKNKNSKMITCPIMCINLLERKMSVPQIKIYTQNMRTFKFVFEEKTKFELFYNFFSYYLEIRDYNMLFGFHHKLPANKEDFGWNLYDAKTEFRRLGLPNENWEISDINQKYELCGTYPKVLVLPKTIAQDKEFISEAAKFRSKFRLPVLCWYNNETKTSISRSSQPLVGLVGSRSTNDEELIQMLRSKNDKEFIIFDARPKNNATANKVLGAGSENIQKYQNCQIKFMNIDNIHVMRDSASKLLNLLKKENSEKANDEWYSSLDDSGWMYHKRKIILSAVQISTAVSNGNSVLIHCSDGWDRTSQLCSLSQLFLDPYYRTVVGFQVLIEKEWLSFGHKFGQRTGIDFGEKKKNSERSPVFFQFIECVANIISQFPTAFEFNQTFLIDLLDLLPSCRFGTFLGNSEKQREALQLNHRTISIWTFLNSNLSKYTNPIYHLNSGVIRPSVNMKDIYFWQEFYFRWDNGYFSKDMIIINLIKNLKLENAKLNIELQSLKKQNLRAENKNRKGESSFDKISKNKNENKNSENKNSEINGSIKNEKNDNNENNENNNNKENGEISFKKSSRNIGIKSEGIGMKTEEQEFSLIIEENLLEESDSITKKSFYQNENVKNIPVKSNKSILNDSNTNENNNHNTNENNNHNENNLNYKKNNEGMNVDINRDLISSESDESTEEFNNGIPQTSEYLENEEDYDYNNYYRFISTSSTTFETHSHHNEANDYEIDGDDHGDVIKNIALNLSDGAIDVALNEEIYSPRRNNNSNNNNNKIKSNTPLVGGRHSRERTRKSLEKNNSHEKIWRTLPPNQNFKEERLKSPTRIGKNRKLTSEKIKVRDNGTKTDGEIERESMFSDTKFMMGVQRPQWVPDSLQKSCKQCKNVFTATYRRHHCRNCGNIFCFRCSSSNLEIPQLQYFRPVRVCDGCYRMIKREEDSFLCVDDI